MDILEVLSDEQSGVYFLKSNVDDKKMLLTDMGSYLELKGVVKSTFIQAIIERERIFPTGLPTTGVKVAIPHTDDIHVNKKCVAVAVLKNPIEFQVMGTEDEFVSVEIVFMLGVKNPQEQVQMLQKLVELCQNESALKLIRDSLDLEKIKIELMSLVN